MKIICLVILFTLIGCSGKSSVPDDKIRDGKHYEPFQLVMFNYSFTPDVLEVEKGAEVIVSNRDPEKHCFTVDGLSIADDIEPDAKTTYTFDTVGEFEGYSSCGKAGMKVKIVVR